MKILSIVGVRPNFVKVAPLHRAFLTYPSIESKIIHTGQHHDAVMSDVFFDQFHLPQPDHYLNVQPGSATRQTADILQKFDEVLQREQPDWVVVVGDVTSTLACTLAASQNGVRVAHVEAGLRSGDRQMPEERNRIVTDALADLLFAPDQTSCNNLRREGIPADKIHLVGNVMIDSLVQYRAVANALTTVEALGFAKKEYVLLTMHRPFNVDTEAGLRRLLQVVKNTATLRPVVFPLHPRTRTNLIQFGLFDALVNSPNVHLLEPLGYLEFINLMENSALVITDSGGVQEETTYLNIPCLTFRPSTERPITVDYGTNQLVADLSPDTAGQMAAEILAGRHKSGQIIPLWDGRTAERIAHIISQYP
jgi:UDP-N-acetylglucosamine 2-epimerase (non-hydrolysing)